ncbi:imelysin family protein [Tropicimonas marinistellae]|uniref:imelysin family protein n=1 Tax=Tropicimonas marinistellae TaxID=1739787 RepID=UPI00082F2775|nr:imelysin family protein [Tropicimonas marinistellae]
MIRILAAISCAIALSPGAFAQSDMPDTAPEMTGGTDHDAVTERALAVLDRQFDRFRVAAGRLEATAVAYCDGAVSDAEIRDALREAWLAWAPLDSYQFGPVEQLGAALRVNFWPDKKNFVGRGLDALMSLPEEAQRDPARVADGSAAAQGLPAMERLVYTDLEPCPTVVGVSARISGLAQDLYDGWFAPDGWADLARAAGPENPIYLSSEEFTRTLFTALTFGLTRVADYRLARPMGTYERSYPRRAEAWRAGLTNDIVVAQLDGLEELVEGGFAEDLDTEDRERILQLFEKARVVEDRISAPIAVAVEDPMTRIRVEALQTVVRQLQLEVAEDLGASLGVDAGFSAADGD